MKRILLLTLIAIMLLSTLVACEGFMVIPINPTNIPTTTTTTSKVDETRHTITAEEWVAFGELRNFTANTGESILQSTEEAIISDHFNNLNVKDFLLFKEEKIYSLFQMKSGWYYYELKLDEDKEYLKNMNRLASIFEGLFTEEYFNTLLYDEETKTYKTGDVEICFENGELIYLNFQGTSMLWDIGTTVIDIPENIKPIEDIH